jgi:anti-sigma regulatory factor (Ser/Thr protein kinase)
VAEIDRTLRLVASPASIRTARDVAEGAASAWGLDEDGCYEFKLAASEAVANAIEHGLPCSDGCIGLRVFQEEPECLAVWVSDCGRFIPRPVEGDDLPERGRGLAVISWLMDEVDLVPGTGGTHIRMRKRRRD